MISRSYVALTVFIALILPIGVGFLLPSSTEERTSYTTDEIINVTSSLENSTYSEDVYSTSYLNNLFLFSHSGSYFQNGDKTTVHNNYPALTQQEGMVQYTTTVTTLDLANIASSYSPTPYCIQINSTNTTTLKIGDLEVERLIYYPGTKILYGFNSDGAGYHDHRSSVTIQPSTVSEGRYRIDYYIQDTLDGKPAYYDPANGFLARGSTYWFNSFTNSVVPILVQSQNFPVPVLDAYGHRVSMNVTDSTISITVDSETKTLGETSAYPYCLILVEKDGISVSGVTNMSKFTDFTISKIGATVEFDTVVNDSITMLNLIPTDDGAFVHYSLRYYIPYVMGGSSVKIPAIENNTLDCRSFYPNDTWAVRLSNLSRSGTTLDINLETHSGNTLTYSYPVIDNAITLSLGGNEYLIPLSKLVVTVIPAEEQNIYELWVGDYVVETLEDGKPKDLTMGFNGTWKTNVQLSKLVAQSHNEFLWTAGFFGLDSTGFCGVGLIASFLAFIGLGVYARQQGDNILPLLIASLVCGGIYMALLMS